MTAAMDASRSRPNWSNPTRSARIHARAKRRRSIPAGDHRRDTGLEPARSWSAPRGGRHNGTGRRRGSAGAGPPARPARRRIIATPGSSASPATSSSASGSATTTTARWTSGRRRPAGQDLARLCSRGRTDHVITRAAAPPECPAAACVCVTRPLFRQLRPSARRAERRRYRDPGISGRRLHFQGVEGEKGEFARQLERYIRGREVVCEPCGHQAIDKRAVPS